MNPTDPCRGELQTTDSSSANFKDSLSFRFGRFLRRHGRWWHVAIASSLLTIVPLVIGISNFLAIFAIIPVIAIVIAFFNVIDSTFDALAFPQAGQVEDATTTNPAKKTNATLGINSTGEFVMIVILAGLISPYFSRPSRQLGPHAFSHFVCLMAVFIILVFLWHWRRSRSWQFAGAKVVLLGFFASMLASMINSGLLSPITQTQLQQPRPLNAVDSLMAESVIPGVTANRNRQRDATRTYWQIAVADLHKLRFDTPAGDESTDIYYQRLFEELRQATMRARMASTNDVAPDLVAMVQRHLAVEDRWLQAKLKMEELSKQAGIPTTGNDTVRKRFTRGAAITEALTEDPTLLEAIPAGEGRSLIGEMVALENLRPEQFREIDIMQAVLQERYRDTGFPLPEINL